MAIYSKNSLFQPRISFILPSFIPWGSTCSTFCCLQIKINNSLHRIISSIIMYTPRAYIKVFYSKLSSGSTLLLDHSGVHFTFCKPAHRRFSAAPSRRYFNYMLLPFYPTLLKYEIPLGRSKNELSQAAWKLTITDKPHTVLTA